MYARVLREIFGPKRDEVTRKWKRLHNELFTKYYSGDEIEKMRWVGHVASPHWVLVERPEERRPLGRSSCKWEDNIEMSSKSVMGWYGLD